MVMGNEMSNLKADVTQETHYHQMPAKRKVNMCIAEFRKISHCKKWIV